MAISEIGDEAYPVSEYGRSSLRRPISHTLALLKDPTIDVDADAIAMTEQYSDLQVDSQREYPKYFSPNQRMGEAKSGFAGHTYSDKIAREKQPLPEVAAPYPPDPQQRQRKRICGVAARTFWIVAAIVAIIVVAAGVGGGVAASVAGKNDSTKSAAALTSTEVAPAASTSSASSTPPSSSASSTSQSSSSTASATSSITLITSLAAPITSTPPSTTSPDSISTSTTIGPSETLLVDCPSSNNTLYVAPGTSQTFQKICSNSLTSIGVNLNAVELLTNSLDGCIAACAAYNVQNATEIADGESNICNTVCWRATITGDDHPGVCFGFTTASSSGSFVYGGDARCDSAALVGQNS